VPTVAGEMASPLSNAIPLKSLALTLILRREGSPSRRMQFWPVGNPCQGALLIALDVSGPENDLGVGLCAPAQAYANSERQKDPTLDEECYRQVVEESGQHVPNTLTYRSCIPSEYPSRTRNLFSVSGMLRKQRCRVNPGNTVAERMAASGRDARGPVRARSRARLRARALRRGRRAEASWRAGPVIHSGPGADLSCGFRP